MFVCLYLIQIHISEPIETKLCTKLTRGLEETVVAVTCVSVSEVPVFIYLLRPPHPVSSFLGNVSRTA